MKSKLAFVALALFCATFSPIGAFAARQGETTLRGSIIDNAGVPVGFATAFLSRADGAVVCGATAGEDGRFELRAAGGDYTLTVSLVGYRDASQDVTLSGAQMELPPIRLEEDAELLGEAVVQAVMPKTKLTGEGLQTNVRGSVLENVGTANDVLAKTPGLIKGQNGLEVIGKGSPLIYINGRRITDAGELDRLQSNEIQSVEVITNPGAQYDASVRSVVRIRTIRRQGDGFGFNFTASDAQSLRRADFNDPAANLNVNYRTGSVDLFAGVNYSKSNFIQLSDAERLTTSSPAYKDEATIDGEGMSRNLGGNAGVNWQVSDNHFLGGKVEWGRELSLTDRTVITDKVSLGGVQIDDLTTLTEDTLGDVAPYNVGTNLYYNGTVGGKLNIDFNADYFTTASTTKSFSTETSTMTQDAQVSSSSDSRNRLYATKLVLSYPVWKGQLQVGTEETFSRRSDDYTLTGIPVPASSASVKENNVAGFASYGFYLPKVGQISAGVRYEHVLYDYRDALAPQNDINRSYGNWFPTVSYANAFGPVQVLLNYSAKTLRPNFSMLSSAIRYNSRYIWQSGNAALQPQTLHDVSLTTVWKFVTVGLDYTRVNDAIATWSYPYNDEGVMLVQPRNLDVPFRTMSAFVNLTPTFGPLSLNYTFVAQPQWLTIVAPDASQPSGSRATSFNDKPLFVAQLFNTLTLNGGWQFELGGEVYSRGYTQNIYLTNVYFNLSAAVQKTLLKDGSLVLRLEGSDLAGMAHNDVATDFGNYKVWQTNIMDTQRLKLSIRYRFNTAQSKYKGTGAGNDTRDRMK